MNNSNRKEHSDGNVITLIAGILTSAFGLLAILGWILQLPMLASFSANHIPMAPSTALLFILMGMALSLRNPLPQYRGTYFLGLSIGLLVAISGLIFSVSSLANNYFSAEHLGFTITDTLNGIQTGHMSLVTAISFVACALVFLLTLSQSVERSKRAWIALALAFTQVLTWIIFLFAYLFVTPLMYSGGFIPPSLPTSLAFLFLYIGLLTSALLQTGLYKNIKNVMGTRVSSTFLLIFILLIIGIVGGGYFAFRGYEKNFRREIEQQLNAVSELKMNQIVQWRNERMGDANVFYRNYVFSDLVKRYFKNQSDTDAKKSIQAWLGQISAANKYNRVCLHDIAGTELISFPQTIIHPTYQFSVNATEVLKSGNVKIQDFYRDENDNKVYLSIFVPILDEFDDKKPIGVIALRIDPTQYLYPMIKKWPTPSKTAETLIIRRDGNDAHFLNELRFRTDAALKLRVPLNNEKMPSVKAVLGQTGIVDGIDYRGVSVIADVRAVPDSPWFIVARIDSEEVYAPLKGRLWMIISFIVLLIIGAGSSVGFVWRQQYKRFHREQYESAEALKISKSTLAAVEQLGKLGGWEFDIDTKVLIWSAEVCRIHEVDITFKPTIEEGINFYAPASRPVIEQAVQRAIGQGEPFDVELQIITAKNNLRWIHSIGNTDQERRKVFGFFQDISERKRAEVELRESWDFTKTVLDNLPIGVAVNSVDPAGNINYMNDIFPAMYQTTREALEVVDNFWNAVYEEPAFREEMRQRVLEDIASGEPERMHWEDIPITRKGVKIKYINARNVPIPGKPLMISTVWDITDRKQAQDKVIASQDELKKALEISNQSRQSLLCVLEDQQEAEKEIKKLNTVLEQRVIERTAQLEASNKELEAFSYSVSHDLRAPLRHINGFVDLLSKQFRVELPEKAHHYLDTIADASKQMGTLIDDLLQFSRTSRQQIRQSYMEMSLLVKEVVEKVKLENESRDITWKTQDLPMVYGDFALLKQVWINLLDNALKYTRNKKNTEISVGYSDEDKYFVLFVRDNGVGFDMKYAHKLFGVFQRLHSQSEFEGTGIGLANVQRIIHKHGGRVWAEAEKGKGATFFFSLPKISEEKI